jgi:integrase
MAIKVKLLKKEISKNRHSLYLDFYPHILHPVSGKPTRREFLKLYVFNAPKSMLDKQHNTNTLAMAEQIRQRRESELNKPEIYSDYEKEKVRVKALGETDFLAYFMELANERAKSNHDNWASAYNYLNGFTGGSLKVADLTEKFCNDFKKHLLTTKSSRSEKTTLSQNSAASYFNKFKAALKQAYKDGYLQNDLNGKVEPIKQAETHRQHLSIDELKSLIKTPCTNPLLKRAALFAAITGLRFSDIKKLVWGEVQGNAELRYLQFTQQKTKGAEVHPINEEAYSLLGEPQQPTDRVFDGLTYSAYQNKHLYQWIGAAGITKNITFHCFRHTYATLQLEGGTDIYTLKEMMGHNNVKTTQVYAKIVNPTKRKAANAIPAIGIDSI